MKKIVSLILALALCLCVMLSFTSCGGEELNFGKEYKAIKSQVDVLLELNAKSIDVGVMDSIMAGYYMTQDSTYASSLMIIEDLALATEQYGIAARKGSGLAKMISKTMIELAKSGVVDEIATIYGIKSELCIDTTKSISELTDAEKEDFIDEYDPKLPEAVDIVLELGQASISMLQRRMRIGYARAGRIIDEMARRGIVSEADGAKPRTVLMSREQINELFEEE